MPKRKTKQKDKKQIDFVSSSTFTKKITWF